ncbi:MAG: hypothetical protein IPL52_10840 [Flavobacteriales bacterium]|nr:hypothetical protein [Flavobacteriales bacterium]
MASTSWNCSPTESAWACSAWLFNTEQSLSRNSGMRTPGAACLPEARRLAEGALRLGAGQHAMAIRSSAALPTATTRSLSWTKQGACRLINVLKNAAEDGRNAYPAQ